uniref:Uncharacterized protein n=1 Tax=Johnson-sea-linkia profunda TaxID=575876 RepID=A0A386AXN4_9CHLO|nr:hypothetical protein [Johnson-sea-linkia profunda]
MDPLSKYLSFSPLQRVIILFYLFIVYHKQKILNTQNTWYIQLFLSEYYKVYINSILLDFEILFKYFREFYTPQVKSIFLTLASTYYKLCQIYAEIEIRTPPNQTPRFIQKCLEEIEETVGFDDDECNFDLFASEQPELTEIDEQIIQECYMIFSDTCRLLNETNELLINRIQPLLPKVLSFSSKCIEQEDFTLVKLFRKKPDFCELYFKHQ